jgi:hypothetical protein
VWLSGFLHTKHNFNPQHHQTPSESLRPGERVRVRAVVATNCE